MNEVSIPPALLFCLLIAGSAAATVVCEEGGWRRGVYLFKPLTTGMILLLALAGGGDPAYRALVCAGLAFSLAGDVFLMLPKDRFVAGLVSFLIAHLLYVAAFVSRGTEPAWWAALPFAVHTAVLLRVLLPRAGALRVPVIVYALALAAMAWLAAGMAIRGAPGGVLAAVGAALFVISDSALAIDRFVRPFRFARTVVLLTYFAAQTLIALSV